MFSDSLKTSVQGLLLIPMCFVVFSIQTVFAQGIALTLRDNNGEPIEGAVMELLSASADSSVAPATMYAEIDQRDKEFVPSVTTVVVGSRVSFPNSDDILHHVYSFSPTKTFDTPLYGSDTRNEYQELFDVPGVVEIGCNIHDWMLAYIYIGESELMAISDEGGIAELADIPPGEYRLKVWHSRLDAPLNSLEQEITITASSAEQLEMTLELVRDRRVRRAPSANRKRYR